MIIWDPLGSYSLWVSPSGSGKTSVWTSLPVYPTPRVGITPYGLSWTVWLSPLTSYLWPPCTESTNMQSYTSLILSVIMVYRRPLSLTEDPSLLHVSGSSYMSVLAPILSKAPLIILRLIVRPSKWTKSLKICSAHVLNDGPKWDWHLPLAEFSYNNSYQKSL
jgi:hypothetical protein